MKFVKRERVIVDELGTSMMFDLFVPRPGREQAHVQKVLDALTAVFDNLNMNGTGVGLSFDFAVTGEGIKALVMLGMQHDELEVYLGKACPDDFNGKPKPFRSYKGECALVCRQSDGVWVALVPPTQGHVGRRRRSHLPHSSQREDGLAA